MFAIATETNSYETVYFGDSPFLKILFSWKVAGCWLEQMRYLCRDGVAIKGLPVCRGSGLRGVSIGFILN